ncbi:hypothetical protein JCM8547_004804 [Rhodosporidiobolus lusitaniae]
MEGIALTDLHGRTFLSTHFSDSLVAKQAIDAACAANQPVVWVPSTGSSALRNGGSSDTSDDEDEDEGEENGWKGAPAGQSRGTAVCQIERGGVRYIAPVSADVDPLVPLTFLTELHSVLSNYISGPVTEASLKDHFDIALSLLQEMVASGRPQLSQSSQLRELVLPPSDLLGKVAQNVVAGTGLAIPEKTAASALLSSPLPWRRQGIKYSSNEIYLDLHELLRFVLLPSGQPLSGSISGTMTCRSRLSGMPDLSLTFVDPSVLEEGSSAFHSCVRYARWGKEKVVSFVPPDGSFPLLTFLSVPPSSTPAHSLALLPFSLQSSVTLNPSSGGGSFHLTLTSRAPHSRPLTNIVVRIPLAREANGVQASVSGGAWLRDEEGRAVGGGAGGWEVETVPGEEGREEERQEVVWKLKQLVASDRPAVLSGTYYCAVGARKPPSFTLTFDSPHSGFSGLRVNALKLVGPEQYNVYKGVKSTGRGEVEVRTG